MARILVVSLLVVIAMVIIVQAHAAYGKPALKTIANIVVHPHHHALAGLR